MLLVVSYLDFMVLNYSLLILLLILILRHFTSCIYLADSEFGFLGDH